MIGKEPSARVHEICDLADVGVLSPARIECRGTTMLVGGTYRFRAGVNQRIGLKRFQAWKPPTGFSFQGHWATADGMGGMFLAEADSAVAAFEATATFADLLEFHVVPVLDIMEAVPVNARVFDWIDSVG